MRRKYFFLILTALILAMCGALTSYVFRAVEVRGGQPIPVPGILMPFFAAVVLGSFLGGMILMIRKYMRARREERVQWRVMLLGVSLSYFLLILTNFVLVIIFENTAFVLFAPLLMLPAIGGMGYAILRHGLLNVKAVAAEIFTFVILSVAVLEVVISSGLYELLFRSALFVLFLVFGILLIRSVLQEVEERRKLEALTAELREANERLKELDRLKSEFLSFASHQVKSPLTVIRGYASLILDGSYGPASEKIKEVAGKIKGSSEQMMSFVKSILDLRQIEEGKMRYSFEEIDMNELVEEVVSGLKPLAEVKGLELRFTPAGNPVKVRADVQKLHQVVQNFLDNAIKYTESGWIKVEVGERDRKAYFSVSDSGRGISKELLPELFKQFSRDISVQKSIQGTGLGLYIAKEIISGHGGEVWAESEGEGRGSKFCVNLPELR